MNQPTIKTAFKLIVIVIITFGLSLALQSVLGEYNGPACPPPGCNVPAPVNVGSSTAVVHAQQYMYDGLSVSAESVIATSSGLGVANDLIVASDALFVDGTAAVKKVGIGASSTSPLAPAKLTVEMGNKPAVEGIHIRRQANVLNSHFSYLNIEDENANSIFKVHESGSVGIGVTNPGALLDITKLTVQGAHNDMQQWTHNSLYSLRLEQRWKTAGRIYYDYITKNNGTDVNALTIDSNGNIGMGTNDPAYKLDVQGSLSVDTIRIKTNGSGSGQVLMNTGSGNATWVATSTLGLGSGGGGSPDFETIIPVNIDIATNYNVPHGLGVIPKHVEVYYCRFSDSLCAGTNFKVFSERWTGADYGAQIAFNSTNVIIHIGGTSVYLEPNEVDGGAGNERKGYYRVIAWQNGGGGGAETDPTVQANVKDGVQWSEISGTCPCGTCWEVTCNGPGIDISMCTPAGWKKTGSGINVCY